MENLCIKYSVPNDEIITEMKKCLDEEYALIMIALGIENEILVTK